jgi:NitT/TauT family transport system substrate-binding protein
MDPRMAAEAEYLCAIASRSEDSMQWESERRSTTFAGKVPMKLLTRRRRLLVALTGLAAATVVAMGCGGDDNDDGGGATAGSGELQKVNLLLSYQRSIAFIGEIMAQENGYFADEGLKVEPQATEGGPFVIQQVVAGNVPFGLSGTQDTGIAVSKGIPLRAIWEHDRDIILIGAPADGDVDSIDDLEGKSLGITEAGGGEATLVKAVLDAEGLTDSVETPAVGVGGAAVFAALESGRIAAYAGYTNDLAGVEAVGMDLIDILPPEFQGFPNNAMVVSEETLADSTDRETAIKIARAWNRGTIDALNDPEHALEVACADYVPQECEDMNVAAAFMNVTLEGIAPREGTESSELGAFDYDAIDRQLTSLAVNLGPEPIDLEQVYTNDYIDEINDFSEPQLEKGAPKLLEIEAASALGGKAEDEE